MAEELRAEQAVVVIGPERAFGGEPGHEVMDRCLWRRAEGERRDAYEVVPSLATDARAQDRSHVAGECVSEPVGANERLSDEQVGFGAEVGNEVHEFARAARKRQQPSDEWRGARECQWQDRAG